jgi:hypothetical protein
MPVPLSKAIVDPTRNMPKSREREELKLAAQTFTDLVEVRNRILHGKPCTRPSGDARLSAERVLEILDLEDAADSFVECSAELNRLSYGFLSTYTPQ